MHKSLYLLISVLITGAWMSLNAGEAPKMTLEQERATQEIHEYFRRVTARLANNDLAAVNTANDWQRLRPQLRGQLLEMLGLSPMPERTDLKATVTGRLEHENFVVENLHFQSMPGLYVTANFYRPKNLDKPAPTILYVCGHSRVVVDGVPHGSKTAYQHHAIWFARHGYCCLVLDTLQLGEIEGIHHGTYREGMWWWIARGYTPAGVEAWNCVRALDYLETRPEVDMTKIGVTGRSGGGAYTWWTGAIDDRPACVIPVAGITDLEDHVVNGCVEGHCDCMYLLNTYQWDYATVAALAATRSPLPLAGEGKGEGGQAQSKDWMRPMLLSNSDKDPIFPLVGVVRTHAKVKRIYDLHGASDKLGLLITEGPHRDTQDLQVPAFRWFNRWLLNKDEQITRPSERVFEPKQLKVFKELPSDARNKTIHETFVPMAKFASPPTSRSQWESERERLLAMLKEKSFRAWPERFNPNPTRAGISKEGNGLALQTLLTSTEENLQSPVYIVSNVRLKNPAVVVLTVVDNDSWKEWLSTVGSAFRDVLPGGKEVTPNPALLEARVAHAAVLPRGIGPNHWNPDQRKDIQIQRRFMLLGTTADTGRVWDVRAAIHALKHQERFAKSKLILKGRGVAAGIALHAGLFEPSVDSFELRELPPSHRDGPIFLNVLRVLDVPQAVALALPRKVVLLDTDPGAWQWTEAVAKLYDSQNPSLEIRKTEPRASASGQVLSK